MLSLTAAGEVRTCARRRYDRTICMYDSERPKNAITRYEKCHEGAICALTIDTDSNWLVTGSYDGSVKLWSQEGRCLDQFMGLADTVTGLVYVETTKTIWTTGKLKRIAVYDPRTPANITKYTHETSQLGDFSIFRLHQVRCCASVRQPATCTHAPKGEPGARRLAKPT